MAYFIFLGLYYCLGMFGFYRVALYLFKDQRVAFTAFLLLLFSSLSSVLFNSFMMLIFTPGVWFFYFLLAFSAQPKKHLFLGLTFCLMVILTTYLPFYFVTIFLVFLVFYVLFYFRDFQVILKRYGRFIQGHKVFVILCTAAVLVSLLPGILFYVDSARDEFVLPMRHGNTATEHVIGVSPQTTLQGGVIAVNFKTDLFAHLNKIQLGTLYVPVFAFVLFLLGVVTRMNKRTAVLGLWAFVIYLISVHGAAPVYSFLYKYVFYFKYFRNFQFFLWLVILPIFILLCAEHLRLFFQMKFTTKKQRLSMSLFIVLIHVFFVLFLSRQPGGIVSTYVVMGLSLLFFLREVWNRKHTPGVCLGLKFSNSNRPPGCVYGYLLLVLVVIQPMEVFHYLSQNAEKARVYRYDGRTSFRQLLLPENNQVVKDAKQVNLAQPGLRKMLPNRDVPYMATRWVNFLYQHISPRIFGPYLLSKLVVYDYVEWVGEGEQNAKEVVGQYFDALVNQTNVAFVHRKRTPGFGLVTVRDSPIM